MQTDFDKYLKRKNVQKKIDKLCKKYNGKKVIIYGTGIFARNIFDTYDFSKLNIVGAADKSYIDNTDGNFYGYTKYSPYDLLENEFDLLLITTYDDEPIKDYIDDLFEGEERKFKTETLVQMNIFEYIKYIYRK